MTTFAEVYNAAVALASGMYFYAQSIGVRDPRAEPGIVDISCRCNDPTRCEHVCDSAASPSWYQAQLLPYSRRIRPFYPASLHPDLVGQTAAAAAPN